MAKLLEQVNSPEDLKRLSIEELSEYAAEVREYIVRTVKKRGGHLASNLGAVELTIALHYVFDSPADKLVFDVGHQSYTHKIITGRREAFEGLRTDEGVSGFPSAAESEHDPFTMGHSSTSLSVGLGLVRAREIKGEKYHVVSVIGDGAFTGGMAFEALNDIGAHHERMLIVLNDNKMSISRNVGALSEYLARLRLSKRYAFAKSNVRKGLEALPFFGDEIAKVLDKAKESVKFSILGDQIFENLGVKYFGPFDGHDIGEIVRVLRRLKNYDGPALLHLITRKGNGEPEVAKNPDRYHGVSPEGGAGTPSCASVVGEKLCELACRDERVVAVTAAMSMGTGLKAFSERYPSRYFDVGIAEEHAATMCAGLAAAGMKPFFAVYSSFLQRAFDQVLHDVCIDSRPVTFLVDHAGTVGGDGVTHQGLFDIAYLSMIPNMTVLQPSCERELKEMMDFAADFGGPLAIRYPKSFAFSGGTAPFSLDWETVARSDERVYILAAGDRAISLSLAAGGANVINARVLKPLDTAFLDAIPDRSVVVTVEEGILRGGFGESVAAYLAERDVTVRTIGFPDRFMRSTSEEKMRSMAGLTAENIAAVIKNARRKRV